MQYWRGLPPIQNDFSPALKAHNFMAHSFTFKNFDYEKAYYFMPYHRD